MVCSSKSVSEVDFALDADQLYDVLFNTPLPLDGWQSGEQSTVPNLDSVQIDHMHDLVYGGFQNMSMDDSIFNLWSPSKPKATSSGHVRDRRHTICGSPIQFQPELTAGNDDTGMASFDDATVSKRTKRFRWIDETAKYEEHLGCGDAEHFVAAGQHESHFFAGELVRPCSAFRRHSTMAISENLYPCPWAGCSKSFNRFYNLRSHYRTHTQEKPFECRHCELAFARNHDLKRHLLIHSDAKPFNCPNCLRSFGRHDAMKRHYRSQVCVKKPKSVKLSEDLNQISELPEDME